MKAFLSFAWRVALAYLAINVITSFVPILGQLVYTPIALLRGMTGISIGSTSPNQYE